MDGGGPSSGNFGHAGRPGEHEDVGTAESGNYGHAGRPGKVGGSAPKLMGKSTEKEKALITKTRRMRKLYQQ